MKTAPFKIWDYPQQSEQWFRVRKGRITASNAERILTPTGKDSSQWQGYAVELIAECLRPDEMPEWTGNIHTDRGNELEPVAREEFARRTGLEVREVGFLTRHDEVVGCSPDALIYRGDTPVAGLELKCPLAKHHATYLIDGGVPAKYAPQVHFSMAATGLPWYFMSYCPGLRPHLVQVEPDGYTRKMQDAIDRFLIFYGSYREKMLPILRDEPKQQFAVGEGDVL
jgi:predicted phage-related endonuclease